MDYYKGYESMRILHGGGGGDHDHEDSGLNVWLKVISIVVILGITVLFGCMPYFW
jgi:hypothetical protein